MLLRFVVGMRRNFLMRNVGLVLGKLQWHYDKVRHQLD